MQHNSAVQSASTASLPRAQRFPFWADVVAQTFVPLECDTPVRSDFSGSIRHRRIGRIGITDVRASAQRAARTRATIARAPSDDLIVVVHVDGFCEVKQGDTTAMLRSGASAAVSAEQPYCFAFPAPFRQLVLKVPRMLLHDIAPRGATRLLSLASGPSNLIRNLTLATLDEPENFSADEEAAVERAVLELLRSAFGGDEPRGGQGKGAARHDEARRFIERNLADPALSPAIVAAHVGVSVRSLARLFALRGTSIERTIWSCRLDTAKADLADPRQKNRSITDVAFSRGYSDSAHFSRSFAKAFGVTPRQFRKIDR